MLQLSLGGYLDLDDVNSFTNAPNVYREPGFNFMSSTGFSVVDAKKIYILLRIRTNNTGTTFEAGTAAIGTRFTVTATNTTTGDDVTVTLNTNNVNTGWNETGFNPYVITLTNETTVSGETKKIKAIDLFIRDGNTTSIASARIVIDITDDQQFSYLGITSGKEGNRPNASTIVNGTGVMKISRSGGYVIISPIGYFVERNKNDSDFSYPLSTIYYKHENAIDNEEYNFALTACTTLAGRESIKVIPIPNYKKAAILRFDGKLQTDSLDNQEASMAIIKATGRISGVSKTFTMSFVPTIGGIDVRSL